MSFAAIGFCMALIIYGASVSAATLAAAPFLGAASRVSHPGRRARAMVTVRVFPSLLAFLIVAFVFLPAFLAYEPRDTTERITAAMAALAGAAALVLVAGPLRGLLSLWATAGLVKRWSRSARPIEIPGIALPSFAVDEPFPLVSLAGVLRPRLYVARSVLEECDRGELAAVAAHEAGHLRRRDPWMRLLVRSCPDPLAMTPVGDRIELAWAEAAEHLADDHAARSRPGAALDLASALVKVARLAGRAKPPEVPLLAVYRGEGVAGRVARLLAREEIPPERAGRTWFPALLAAALLLGVVLAVGLSTVHALAEAVVTFLQ